MKIEDEIIDLLEKLSDRPCEGCNNDEPCPSCQANAILDAIEAEKVSLDKAKIAK